MLPTASLTIAELFSNPYLLNVPIYQRAYSWGGELAEQLYDDLIEALNFERDEGTNGGYFLGAMLLMDSSGLDAARLSPKLPPREFDIVDGQQRLITLMTLVCVLRDQEKSPRGPISRRAPGMIVAQQGSRFFRTERYRLHLSGADRGFFETYVLQQGATAIDPAVDTLSASERAILSARNTLRSLAADMTDQAREQLFAYMADKCHVVVIVSTDIDRAYRLFVVLNERGKRLQRNDILKADLLSRVPAADIAWASDAWDDASFRLGSDFEAFFAHIRTIYGFTRPQIVSGVRAVIASVGGAEPFLRNVFQPLATAYADIRRSRDESLPGEVARKLIYLNRNREGDWAPAAMLALKNWREDPARAEMLISEIDRFAHLIRVACVGSGKRVRRFSDFIAAMRSGDDLSPAHPGFQLTREEQRSIGFHLKDLHKRNPKCCKLLLMRLSDELAGTTTEASPDAYTVEHILPQRPAATSEWRRWYPSAEDRGGCVESLGNLVLISQAQNDRARNASWSEKKAIYAAPPPSAPLLAITAEVLDSPEWRPEDVMAREARLLRLIEQTFRIDLGAAR